jgi:hypothetical protein
MSPGTSFAISYASIVVPSCLISISVSLFHVQDKLHRIVEILDPQEENESE